MGCNQVDNIIQDIASFINELLDIETKKTSFDRTSRRRNY